MTTRIILNAVFSFLILGIIISCKPKDCEFTLKNFNSIEWKEDSLGCLKKREIIYQELISKKNDILQKTDCQIINLLGEPNIIIQYGKEEDKYYYYFIESGPQCTPSKLDTPYVAKLYLVFNKQNKIIKIGTEVP